MFGLVLMCVVLMAMAPPALACAGRDASDPWHPIDDEPGINPREMTLIRVSLNEEKGEFVTTNYAGALADMIGICRPELARRMFKAFQKKSAWWRFWVPVRVVYYVSVPSRNADAFRRSLRDRFARYGSLHAEVSDADITQIRIRIRGEGASFSGTISPWSLFDPGITEPLRAPNGVRNAVFRLERHLRSTRRAALLPIVDRASAPLPKLAFEVEIDARTGYARIL